MTVNLKGVNKITFTTNPDTLVTIIVPGKTMNDALTKAKDIYGFKGDALDKSDVRDNTWIGIMKYSDYAMKSSIVIPMK